MFVRVVPICQVDYVQSFILNTVVMPISLMSLVAATWMTNTSSEAEDETEHDANEDAKASKRSRRADFYFAFFLCYQTMTQTFFGHFNCRTLDESHSVLEAGA
eukprot:SAG31_NODE_3275_length_4474_cov_17.108114_5_plen_103_part_00